MYEKEIAELLQAIQADDLATIKRFLNKYKSLLGGSHAVVASSSNEEELPSVVGAPIVAPRHNKSFLERVPAITSGLLGVGGGVYSAISIFNGANSVITDPIKMAFVNTLFTIFLAGGSYALDAFHVRNKVNELNKLTNGEHVVPLFKEVLILMMGIVLLAIFNGLAFTYAKDASKAVLNTEASLLGLALGLPTVLRQLFVSRPISQALEKAQIAAGAIALQEQVTQFKSVLMVASASLKKVDEIENLRNQKTRFKRLFEDKKEELETVTTSLKEKEGEIENLLGQIDDIQRDILNNKQEILDLTENDKENKEIIQSLQAENTKKQALVESLQKTVEELHLENQQLKEGIKQAKKTDEQLAATSSAGFFKPADTTTSRDDNMDASHQRADVQSPPPPQ